MNAATALDTVVYAIGNIRGRCDLLQLMNQPIFEDAQQQRANGRQIVDAPATISAAASILAVWSP